MSRIANKATLYAVMRFVEGQRDTVCCFCKTLERAEELCGEYEQKYRDEGWESSSFYFYPVANIFYDH